MLQGDRVVLRPIQAWDRERLYELVETIEMRALSDSHPPLPRLPRGDRGARQAVDRGRSHRLGLVRDRRGRRDDRHVWPAIDRPLPPAGRGRDPDRQGLLEATAMGRTPCERWWTTDSGSSTWPRSRSRCSPMTSARSGPTGRPGSSRKAACAITRWYDGSASRRARDERAARRAVARLITGPPRTERPARSHSRSRGC